MQPVGVSNNRRAIAVPFGCKVIVQIPRESSLCTDGSPTTRIGQWTAFTQEQTTPLPQFMYTFSKLTRQSCLQIGKHFQTIFLFATRTCSLTNASSQQKMPGACIKRECRRKGFHRSQHSIALTCHCDIRIRFTGYQQKARNTSCHRTGSQATHCRAPGCVYKR